jgi:hypothetical protein
LKVGLVAAVIAIGTQASAAGDTAIANLNISGTVPAVFSVTARGLPGDLDLTPGSIVIDRVIGLLHFKYNENATITIASSTANGLPANAGGTDYPFLAGNGLKVKYIGTCDSLDSATFGAGVTLLAAGANYASTKATDLVLNNASNGIEEDCTIVANWKGTASTLPLAGVYSMSMTVTMVAL